MMYTSDDSNKTTSSFSLSRVALIAGVGIVILGVFVVQPALAQETNPICQDDSETIVNMIEGFLQITTAFGLMGLVIVWQADALAKLFTIGQERKKQLKRHKMDALKSATVLVLLGPVFTIAGGAMDLPIAQCVDLIPF